MLAFVASRAFALSLLERRPAGGSDGDLPSLPDVLGACHHLLVVRASLQVALISKSIVSEKRTDRALVSGELEHDFHKWSRRRWAPLTVRGK